MELKFADADMKSQTVRIWILRKGVCGNLCFGCKECVEEKEEIEGHGKE